MRYKHKPYPEYGDKRKVHNRFLFLPKTIDRETRWLEKVSWVECYGFGVSYLRYFLGIFPWGSYEWIDEEAETHE